MDTSMFIFCSSSTTMELPNLQADQGRRRHTPPPAGGAAFPPLQPPPVVDDNSQQFLLQEGNNLNSVDMATLSSASSFNFSSAGGVSVGGGRPGGGRPGRPPTFEGYPVAPPLRLSDTKYISNLVAPLMSADRQAVLSGE